MWCVPHSLMLIVTIATATDDHHGNIDLSTLLDNSLENPLGNSVEEPIMDVWSENCLSMDPGNGSAQTGSPCPHRLKLSKTKIALDETVQVTLKATRPNSFKGFMVQARDGNTGEAVGKFDTDYVDVKFINCFGRKFSTATHVNNLPKIKIILRWTPDAGVTMDKTRGAFVTFYVTVANEVNPLVYWAKEEMGTVSISNVA